MKVSTILSFSALFMASLTSAVMPDNPLKVDTCVTPGVVAWTFDDGPGPYTEQLLGKLAKRNIKATFFVLGQMVAQDPAQAALLKKMLEGGHQIASHTYNHKNLDQMTPELMKKEITDTSDVIFKNAGVRPAYMRAPEGACADVCTKTMEGLNQVVSHWNADTNDWRHKADPKAVELSMQEVNNLIINNSDPKTDSFILLQHDIHQFSVEKLADAVADAITAKGYRFVTMEECVGKPAYLEGSAPKPTGSNSTSPTSSNSTAKPSQSADKKDSGASVKQIGAWAMGVAAVAGAFLL
ncbi:hypothetical protein BGW42_007902 [Actinomortierella wolfii]|nr:hypothetical protein BGW42_007902 [Actinomortierella wolfii]